MPSFSVQVAPVGQTFVHGALRQCWHARRHVEAAGSGTCRRRVVRIGVGEIDALLLVHRQHADPLHLRTRATGCSPRRTRRRSGGSRCSARGRARRRTARPASGPHPRPSRPCRTSPSTRAPSRRSPCAVGPRDLVQAARTAGGEEEARRRRRGDRRELPAADRRSVAVVIVRHDVLASTGSACGRQRRRLSAPSA